MSEKGFFGGVFDDDTILWFIILFLLLFWCWSGYGYDYGAKVKGIQCKTHKRRFVECQKEALSQ